MNRRLRYVTQRSINCQLNGITIDDEGSEVEIIEQSSNINATKALQFLKTCEIKTTDRQMIIDNLNNCRHYRSELMNDENSDIREHFPFFLSNPGLVNV